jgi:hypothetical protein
LLKKKKQSETGEIPPEVLLARSIHLAMRSNNPDFDSPDIAEHVLRTSTPAAMHVADVCTPNALSGRKVVPSTLTSSSSAGARISANLTDVSSALQQVFDQNKTGFVQDNSEVLALLHSISADVKLVLAQVVQMNEMNQREDKPSKQPRLH